MVCLVIQIFTSYMYFSLQRKFTLQVLRAYPGRVDSFALSDWMTWLKSVLKQMV